MIAASSRSGVGQVYGPLIYGRICDILEGKVPELPEQTEDKEVVAKNLDLANVAPKDPSNPAVQPNKAGKGAAPDGGSRDPNLPKCRRVLPATNWRPATVTVLESMTSEAGQARNVR
jgi:hypothetical protein